MNPPTSYDDLGRLLWLNLDFTTLYGFENDACAHTIDSIIKGSIALLNEIKKTDKRYR